jgi:hypothetical protein
MKVQLNASCNPSKVRDRKSMDSLYGEAAMKVQLNASCNPIGERSNSISRLKRFRLKRSRSKWSRSECSSRNGNDSEENTYGFDCCSGCSGREFGAMRCDAMRCDAMRCDAVRVRYN